jgi:glucose/arabinose dehydrogenase
MSVSRAQTKRPHLVYDQFHERSSALLALIFSIATFIASPAAAAPAVTLQEVASGFQSPVELVHSGDGSGRLFVVEQPGRIKLIQGSGAASAAFLDISSIVSSGGEKGLLGLAFHPQYANNRAFYVYYTRVPDGALTIARYLRSATNPAVADPNSGAVILTIPHPNYQNHNGGHLAFGFDGYLYIGTGDGGGGGDPDGNSQRLSTRLGKMLRIAVDGGTGYTIPPTNPFASRTDCSVQCPEIWAYGLRNPWKFTFDRTTGDLFIGDVGQGLVEEVSFVPAGAPGGINFGWNTFEGSRCYSPAANCSLPNHALPIIEYGHDNSNFGGFSVTGGYRYRGTQSPALQGYYFYGDFSSQRVWVARPENGVWRSELLFVSPSSISSFGEDEAGELYLVGYGTGRIYALKGEGTASRSLSLSADATNPRAGTPLTLTALVRGVQPTGTVSIRASNPAVSSPITVCQSVTVRPLPGDTNAAVATCTTTADSGVRSYTASYAGDAANVVNPAAFNASAMSTTGAAAPGDATDLWWAGASEDGWGATIIQKGSTQFNLLYVFDQAGRPVWYSMPGGTWNADFTRYSGALYQPTGAPFSAYDPTRFVVGAPVGNATFSFAGAANATLDYTINGTSGTKAISRLPFGPADSAPRINVQDMWWVGATENGWGVSITQQQRTLFAAWYTYDAAGKTIWYVMPGGTWNGLVYSGALYTSTSSPWLGVPYNVTQFRPQWVGQLTFNFTDASNATMTYNVNGVTQTKAITRYRF